jgi:hypothetical protein
VAEALATTCNADTNLIMAVKLLVAIFVTEIAEVNKAITVSNPADVTVVGLLREPFSLIEVLAEPDAVLSTAKLDNNCIAVVTLEVVALIAAKVPSNGTYLVRSEFCILERAFIEEARRIAVVKLGVADATLKRLPNRFIAVVKFSELADILSAVPSSLRPTNKSAFILLLKPAIDDANFICAVKSEVAIFVTAAIAPSITTLVLRVGVVNTVTKPRAFNVICVSIVGALAVEIPLAAAAKGTPNMGVAVASEASSNAPASCICVISVVPLTVVVANTDESTLIAVLKLVVGSASHSKLPASFIAVVKVDAFALATATSAPAKLIPLVRALVTLLTASRPAFKRIPGVKSAIAVLFPATLEANRIIAVRADV